MTTFRFALYALLYVAGAATFYALFPVRIVQVEAGSLADWAVKKMKEVVECTHDTTHWACPVDESPCWRSRADDCPHLKGGVRPCVRESVGDIFVEHRETWAALAGLNEKHAGDDETTAWKDVAEDVRAGTRGVGA
jgi:hypothetical protein